MTSVGKKTTDAGMKMTSVGRKTTDAGMKMTSVGRRTEDAGMKMTSVGRKTEDVGKKAIMIEKVIMMRLWIYLLNMILRYPESLEIPMQIR